MVCAAIFCAWRSRKNRCNRETRDEGIELDSSSCTSSFDNPVFPSYCDIVRTSKRDDTPNKLPPQNDRPRFSKTKRAEPNPYDELE